MSPPTLDPADPAAVRRESLAALARVYHTHAAECHATAGTIGDLDLRDDIHATSHVLLALAHALESAAGDDPAAAGLDHLNALALTWLGSERYALTFREPEKAQVPA